MHATRPVRPAVRAPAYLPELEAYYHEQCAHHGTTGFVVSPPPDLSLVFVSDDPDRAWAEIGPYFLHEATTYAGWQTPTSSPRCTHTRPRSTSFARRASYAILTPEQCLERAARSGADGVMVLHPLCAGIPVDRAWECLHLYADKVLGAAPAA